MSVQRVGSSFALAFVVTASLFGLMIGLIAMGDAELEDKGDFKLPEFIMPDAEVSENKNPEKPDKPEQQDTPDDMPEPEFDNMDVDSGAGGLTAQMNIGEKAGTGLSASDGEYLPIVKVQPQYPRRAAQRGIEGYVILQFTVTKAGTVKDPVVIEAQPPGVFDRAAIKAALKWKYNPRMENGEAIDVPGVKNRVVFRLGKG